MSTQNTPPKYSLLQGDCLEKLGNFCDNSIDAIVTDPPYGLSFMGKKWDYDIPSEAIWRECLRVLKPGGHLLAFAGTRTQHRMAVRIENAGFEIRDMIAWVYGSGFPKSLDVSKAIDKHGGQSVAWFGPWFRKWREQNGITQKQVAALFPSKTGGLTGCVANWELGFNMPTPEQFNLIRDTFGLPFESVDAAEREVVGQREWTNSAAHFVPGEDHAQRVNVPITAPATDAAREWSGWGTALKPALEPITLARKPLAGTVVANVLEWGTGAINIDGCRVEGQADRPGTTPPSDGDRGSMAGALPRQDFESHTLGRWPANLIHDGSDEVVARFPVTTSGKPCGVRNASKHGGGFSEGWGDVPVTGFGDTGSAARFFYCAKASKRDRDEGLEDEPDRILAMLNQAQAELARGNMHKGNSGVNTAKIRKNNHATVKPTELMRYLCRLVTPPGGMVLDPFMGSGSTGKAAIKEGFHFIGIEQEAEFFKIASARIENALKYDNPDLRLPI